jgi:SAM-dependent methyltransferase
VSWRRTARRLIQWPPIGHVRLGALDRTRPVDSNYGWDRGTPVDRFYIDDFLTTHVRDVRGRVLEVGGDDYTVRFGGDRVTRSDVLHAPPGGAEATIVADLADAPQVPDDTFDCAMCTQTLMLIYDIRAAIRTLHRILAPGGVAFATVPGVSRICQPEDQIWGDWWRFTGRSIRTLFEEAFGEGAVHVEVYGNVLAATAQLYGLAAEELTNDELDERDPNFEVLLCVRAQKVSRG